MNNTCKCGNNIDHPNVTYKCEYSKWGWFLLTVLGMSAKPTKVSFLCTICNETFQATADDNILNQYIGR